jgi:hypothetical protein
LYIASFTFPSSNININLDSDEVYFTLVENNKIVDLQSFLGDETHSDEMLEEFKPFLASTIKSTNNNTLSEFHKMSVGHKGFIEGNGKE